MILGQTCNQINGLNLYSYCLNNPIKYIDSTGRIPFVNVVKRSHYTTPNSLITNKLFSTIFGNISLSATQTHQRQETGFFYAFSDIGNDLTSYGIGINAWGWLGLEVGLQTDGNFAFGLQLTPWVHAGVQLGLSGIGFNLGFNLGDTSYDLSINIGWETIAVVATAATIIIYAPVLAPMAAIVILRSL
jgi:hypothetical protein